MRRTYNSNKITKKETARLENWKQKAVERRQIIQRQQKELKTLRQSRDLWKHKYKSEQEVSRQQRGQLAKLSVTGFEGQKVRHHSYKSLTILLAVGMRLLGMISLRDCQKLLMMWYSLLTLDLKVPSINTIRNWEYKLGYYELHQAGCPEDVYSLILDESFCIGKQTLLLVLGVNLSTYSWKGALSFEDMRVLALGPKSYWKGEEIEQLIEGLKQRNYRISYGVSDGGKNLVKALKNKQIARVEDCTHVFSKLLEKRYKNDPEFKEFCAQTSLLNRQCWMSCWASICPPKLKGKARFLNLYSLADWGEKNLKLLKILSAQEHLDEQGKQLYEKLKWLEHYTELVEHLVQLTELIKACFKLLKTQGLSLQSGQQIRTLLDQKQVPAFFDQGVRQYLDRNSELLTQHDRLVCCSDIIESFFGKYKSQQRVNPATGITSSCLRMANYGKTIDEETMIKSLEQVKIVDLQDWQTKNLLPTVNAKKRALYKICG